MKESLKIQLRLMITSKRFNLSMLFCVVLAALSVVYYGVHFYGADINEVPAVYSLLVLNGTDGLIARIYYTLFPLLVVLPFADSFFTDRSNHTVYAVLARCSRKHYYNSKLITVGLSGVSAVLVLLVTNFLLCWIAFPDTAYVEFFLGFGKNQNQLFSIYPDYEYPILFDSLLCKNQYLYVLVFLLLQCFFGGLIAIIVFQLSFFFTKNRLLLNCSFFILLNVLEYIPTHGAAFKLSDYFFSDVLFGNQTYWMLAVLMLVFLLAAFLPVPWAKKRLDELL